MVLVLSGARHGDRLHSLFEDPPPPEAGLVIVNFQLTRIDDGNERAAAVLGFYLMSP